MRSTLFVCPAAGGSSPQRQSLAGSLLTGSLTGHRTAYMVLLLYHWPVGHRQMNLLAERPNLMSYALIDPPGASISTQKMQV